MRHPSRWSIDEVRAWAYREASEDEPCQDWDLVCSWARNEVDAYARLAADALCPRRLFFLHVLYLMVGNAIRRGEPSGEVEATIARANGVGHPDIRRWQHRARELLRYPTTFNHPDWCGGGLAGVRPLIDEDELAYPWTTRGATDALVAELARELGRRHPLFGVKARAIARREDCDDVLFALEGGVAPFAVVHLTWSRAEERDPRWPSFECFDTLAAWRAARDRHGRDR